MKILVGDFYQGFPIPGELGFGGNEIILLQTQLTNLNRLQNQSVKGPSIVAKAIHDGFWLGTSKDDPKPEKTLIELKKVLEQERVCFFPVYRVRNFTNLSTTGGRVWVSTSKSSYAANFVQLGMVFKDAKSSAYYLFRRAKSRIDLWVRTEKLDELRKYLELLGCEKLLEEAIKLKKQLLREAKTGKLTSDKLAEQAVNGFAAQTKVPKVKKPATGKKAVAKKK